MEIFRKLNSLLLVATLWLFYSPSVAAVVCSEALALLSEHDHTDHNHDIDHHHTDPDNRHSEHDTKDAQQFPSSQQSTSSQDCCFELFSGKLTSAIVKIVPSQSKLQGSRILPGCLGNVCDATGRRLSPLRLHQCSFPSCQQSLFLLHSALLI